MSGGMRWERGSWSSPILALALGGAWTVAPPARGDACAIWEQKQVAGPSERLQHAMAYDSARGVTVLFGGSYDGNETWEWNGNTWALRSTSGPSARYLHAMAYDDRRAVVVLFGGAAGSLNGETWEWNGVTWTQRSSSGPAARYGHAMAYDRTRGVTVLVGGFSGLYSGETWEWDGNTWSLRADSGPGGRVLHTLAFDQRRGVVVLFGGDPGGAYRGDTWEWDGDSWYLAATSGPSARADAAMAYDATHGKCVLFGGMTQSTGVQDDTWEWDGVGWLRRFVSGPTARVYHAVAYDSGRATMVLFGGNNGRDETWEYTNFETGITHQPDGRVPCEGAPLTMSVSAIGIDLSYMWLRDGHLVPGATDATLTIANAGLADSGEYEAVVFGDCGWAISEPATVVVEPTTHIVGQPQGAVACAGDEAEISVDVVGADLFYAWFKDGVWQPDLWGDTLHFDWTRAEDAGSYDVMIFGNCGIELSDAAELAISPASVVITQQPTAGTVLAGGAATLTVAASGATGYQWFRDGLALINDGRITGATTDQLTINPLEGIDAGNYDVMVSGSCGRVLSGQARLGVWEACEPTWIDRTGPPGSGPAARHSPVMVFDSGRNVAVLFGGVDTANRGDTWEWNGLTWTLRSNAGPSPRRYHSMAYDSVRDVTVLFGGFDTANRGDTWEWNGASWSYRTTSASPTPRYVHSMAFDAARGVTVLFGGYDNADLGDTWEWNGATWTQRAVSGPPPRHVPAMAYDNARHVCVLFGGYRDGVPLGDTWEWDGNSWQLRTTTGPSPRYYHNAAFDAVRGVTLVYGGWNGAANLNDAWEWDGATWRQVAAAGPPARHLYAFAFDSARAACVMFGGYTTDVAGDTWELHLNQPLITQQPADRFVCEGQPVQFNVAVAGDWPVTYQWYKDGGPLTDETQPQLAIAAATPADAGSYYCDVSNEGCEATCESAALTVGQPPQITQQPADQSAYAGQTVQFTVTATGADTYQWRKDGSPLTDDGRITGATTPALTIADLLTADAGDYDVVVSGPCGTLTSQAAHLTVTLVPCNPRWEQRTTYMRPSPRFAYGLAYDAARGVSVLFGGDGGGWSPRAGTWEWDGTAWALRTTVGPQPRISGPLAYDSQRRVTVLFGGTLSTSMVLGDTWEWDGNSWAERQPATAPTPRYGHAFAYDSLRGVTVMFAGMDAAEDILPETWEWDGVTWTQRNPPSAPTPRHQSAMCFDAARGVMVLFGGWDKQNPLGDTWEWDGTTWQCVATGGPSPRLVYGIAYDSVRQKTVMFGGYDGGRPGDTWEWDGQAWTQVTVNSPGQRDWHTLVYDSARRAMVFFGGVETGSTFMDDTWELYHGAAFTEQPRIQSVCEGGTAHLSATADGAGPTTYQWYKDGAAIPGATQHDLTISPVSAADAGLYHAVADVAGCQTASTPARLNVWTPPQITRQPADRTFGVGCTATFSVDVSGGAPVTAQWRKNGENLVDGGRISGATTTTLTISAVEAADIGAYDVTVTSSCGQAQSAAAQLDVVTCAGSDVNCDGTVNPFDIQVFLNLVADPSHTPCGSGVGDMNQDGTVNNFDTERFAQCICT